MLFADGRFGRGFNSRRLHHLSIPSLENFCDHGIRRLMPMRVPTTMTRRSFTQLASLAALGAGRSIYALAPDRPLRFAVVGLGNIADTFMQACAHSKNCKVTALVSGHAQQKAPKYQGLYGIAQNAVYTYDTYDDIARNPDIDAVYIALPNSLHAEYTIRAAKAGKHVLCEKPMAISSAECRAMITACRNNRVKLMIAYRIHFDPMWQQIRDLARSGAIGEIQGFKVAFTAKSSSATGGSTASSPAVASCLTSVSIPSTPSAGLPAKNPRSSAARWPHASIAPASGRWRKRSPSP